MPPPISGRTELLGVAPGELSSLLRARLGTLGEPRYRVDQVRTWIYAGHARGFDAMTDLPGALRGTLEADFSLTPLTAVYTDRSRDGTVKHLWELEDGEQVESVLIPAGGRLTLCLSSQAGCPLACRFCATGHFGFRRQLSAGEIVAQYRDSARFAESELGRRITHVVYMGMGEPLANLPAVVASLRVLNGGFRVGARRVTVSTVGLVPGILALARRPEPFGLAVSLHAPLHELRLALMPVEKRYPLDVLFRALRRYQRLKDRRISLEYTLIHGVNDNPELADTLADLATGLDCFVNLIPFNPIRERPDWRASSPERIRRFGRVLRDRGVKHAIREPRGRDIAAACGQLRLARPAGRRGGD
ncbi:MAG: 23S rRNA (adenine(2503)-C(2))-methyltransferase RlmN [Gemmatimonadota bacterium]